MAAPAVFVFIQAGCGACHDYMPKFDHVAAQYPGPSTGGPAVGRYDIAQGDRRIRKFAESMGIRATPTTVVMTSNGRIQKREGSLPITTIRELFASAR